MYTSANEWNYRLSPSQGLRALVARGAFQGEASLDGGGGGAEGALSSKGAAQALTVLCAPTNAPKVQKGVRCII